MHREIGAAVEEVSRLDELASPSGDGGTDAARLVHAAE
jgi:hypothetical protein